jgi:hypothetical protein
VFWKKKSSPVVVAVLWLAGVERGGEAVQQRPGAIQRSAAEAEAEAGGRAAVKQFARATAWLLPPWAVWANYGLRCRVLSYAKKPAGIMGPTSDWTD